MEFLRDHLPESDLDCYPPGLFLRFTDHALSLRRTAPWCARLDWESFAHYVLFPRVNDEDLSFHRDLFHQDLWPRVKDIPCPEERVLEVNRWCHEHASYQAQDNRTASPLTVYRCGSGRCGEESAFLVSALRSVGIPARQVYAPRWSHCDDNHAWVEALCGGAWRFLGACEPEPELDRGWFTTAASRAMLVHSRIFGPGASPLHGEPLGGRNGVLWFNQTARYADTIPYTVQVFIGGKPASGAQVEFQLLNESSFHTIARLSAGETGAVRASLGRGSLHVLARLDGLAAEGDCENGGLVLHLAPPKPEDAPWRDFDFRAPADCRPAPAVLSQAMKRARADTRLRGDRLRLARCSGHSQPGPSRWEDLRRKARGNWSEIRSFLEGAESMDRERLVRTLSDKDLRDASRPVLEDHFNRLPPQPAGVSDEVYWNYTACPRIALEALTPWRGPLARRLEGWTGTPRRLWAELQRTLAPLPSACGLCWSPEAALARGGCDGQSMRLLFTAALRTLGVPARLRPLDGAPEYWDGGAFRPAAPEETGVLRLTCPGGPLPRYRREWTISRRVETGWQLLFPDEVRRGGGLELTLPAGQYRLITSVRLPSGDQLASRCEFVLAPRQTRSVQLRLRPLAPDDLFTSQELPALFAQTPEGQPVPDLFRMGNGPVLALWLEEGREPTEHVLNELMERGRELDALPLQVLFLLRSRESAAQPTLAAALARLRRVQVLLDDWAYDLEAVARHLGRDPDSPPLAVVSDGAGRAVYSSCGYRVGSVALLLRVAAHLCKETAPRGPRG